MKLFEVVDTDYYMKEACGIFAYSLSKLYPGGTIIILVNTGIDAEPWSRSIPYEITHVAYKYKNLYYDAKGSRNIQEMANDFHLGNSFRFVECYPDEFKKKYMGTSDRYPLYGSQQEFKETIKYIQTYYQKLP